MTRASEVGADTPSERAQITQRQPNGRTTPPRPFGWAGVRVILHSGWYGPVVQRSQLRGSDETPLQEFWLPVVKMRITVRTFPVDGRLPQPKVF
jgi:hypothetical protein